MRRYRGKSSPVKGVEYEQGQIVYSGWSVPRGVSPHYGATQLVYHAAYLPQPWVRPCHCAVQLDHRPEAFAQGGWGDWMRRYRGEALPEGGVKYETTQTINSSWSTLRWDSLQYGATQRAYYANNPPQLGGRPHDRATQQSHRPEADHENSRQNKRSGANPMDRAQPVTSQLVINTMVATVCGAAVLLLATRQGQVQRQNPATQQAWNKRSQIEN